MLTLTMVNVNIFNIVYIFIQKSSIRKKVLHHACEKVSFPLIYQCFKSEIASL